MLALVAAFVENPVGVEKYSLLVELPGKTIEPESYVHMVGDSKGVPSRTVTSIVARPAELLVSPACKRSLEIIIRIRIFTKH